MCHVYASLDLGGTTASEDIPLRQHGDRRNQGTWMFNRRAQTHNDRLPAEFDLIVTKQSNSVSWALLLPFM